MANMTATIRDVAERAGVSVATVSRLVNNTGRVREETAAHIRAAIDELGFRPNAVGRSLKKNRTRSLGVVIPSMSNPVFSEAVAGIKAEARARGYWLMFTSPDYAADEEVEMVSLLLDYRVEGMILTVANPHHSPALDILQRAGVPYVLIYNQVSDDGHPTVTVDNIAAGREVAHKLIDMGHRRLGIVSGRFDASDRAHARRDGFIDGASERGVETPIVLEVDFLAPKMKETLNPVYADPATAPTALFCSNDLLAISVVGALGRMNLNVPKDVSVIGFDGIAVGTHLHPTLATVVQPSHEMGRVATRHLLDRLTGENRPKMEILPHTFRMGESAGPVLQPSPADPRNPNRKTTGGS